MEGRYKTNLLIVGNIGVRNIGDDAITVAFLKWLNERSVGKWTLYVRSSAAYLKNELKGLQNINVRFVCGFDLLKIFPSSHVIICGGDYLDDFGSTVTRLREFGLLLALSFFTKIFSKKLLMPNNGVRVNSHLGLSFEKLFLPFVNFISVRDKDSYNVVFPFKHVTHGFDSAVLWANAVDDLKTKLGSSVQKIGFSISPFYKNFFSEPANDRLLAEEIARSLSVVLGQKNSVEIYLVAFSTSKKSGDLPIISNVIQSLQPNDKARVKIIAYDGKIFDFLKKLSSMDFMVCCKYHSILFAYTLNKPMLVIKYHPKTLALAKEVNLSLEAVMSPQDILEGNLSAKIFELLTDSPTFRAKLPLAEAKQAAISSFEDCIASIRD